LAEWGEEVTLQRRLSRMVYISDASIVNIDISFRYRYIDCRIVSYRPPINIILRVKVLRF